MTVHKEAVHKKVIASLRKRIAELEREEADFKTAHRQLVEKDERGEGKREGFG